MFLNNKPAFPSYRDSWERCKFQIQFNVPNVPNVPMCMRICMCVKNSIDSFGTWLGIGNDGNK